MVGYHHMGSLMMEKKIIKLDKFRPRPYQWQLIDAVFKDKYKNLIACWPRRAGKDLTIWNICINLAVEKPMTIYYLLPTYNQAKKTVWTALDKEGNPFLSYIPDEIIKSKHEQEMRIVFTNNSSIQLVGGDSFNSSVVGSNPKVCVFSEYSLMNKAAYEFASPILAENDGIAIFAFTPRGRNWAYDLYSAAIHWNDWYVSKLTLNDTKHISDEALASERKKHSEEFVQQEFFTDFSRGIEGSVFGRLVDIMHNEERICSVPYLPNHKVHTSWDIGNNQNMFIILFQVVSNNIRIIETISLKNAALPEHIAELKKRNYTWGLHIGPHDIKKHETGTNVTIWAHAKNLGIQFKQAPGMSQGVGLVDGIETTKAIFPRLWIDSRCDRLISALENYHYELDEMRNIYKDKPARDWSNHACDSLRYLALCVDSLQDGLTAKELDERFAQARGGIENVKSPFFNPFPNIR